VSGEAIAGNAAETWPEPRSSIAMNWFCARHALRQVLRQGSLLAALTGVTRASPAQPLNLSYVADQGCPDRAAFEQAVRAKSGAPSPAATTDDDSAISLRLSATNSGYLGELKLRRSTAASYERAVVGASCSEVADALAFVLALALSEKDQPSLPTHAPGAASPSSPRLSEPRRELNRPHWRLGAGAQIGVRGGLSPELPVAEALHVVAQRPSVDSFGLELRLSFERAQSVSQLGDDAATQFDWWAGRFDVCPVALHPLNRLALRPCLGAHLGRVSGSGRPTRGTPGEAAQIWADAVAAARVQLALLGKLTLEVQGDLIVPPSRYQFAFDSPDTTIYRVPSLAAAGFVGLVVLFP